MKQVKKLISALLATTIVTMCLAGCSPKLKHGEVYAKEFIPAHTVTMFVPMVHTTGKSTWTQSVPFIYHYPDDYTVSIKANDGSGDTATYHVTKNVYDAVDIGYEFQWDSESCSDTAPYTRERE